MRRLVLWLLFALVLALPVVAGVVAWAGVPVRGQLARREEALGASSGSRKVPHLKVSSATVKLDAGNVLVGVTTVENAGAARARSSTAAVAWSSSGGGGMVQLRRFRVPALAPGHRSKARFDVVVPNDASGTYEVSICVDVLGQVEKFSEKRDCRKAGTVIVGSSGVKGFEPTGPEPSHPSGPPSSPSPSPGELSPSPAPSPAPSSPPDTVIDSGPRGTAAQSSATFVFHGSDADDTFQCGLDGAPWAACTSPQQYTSLADGTHIFQVRAVNSAGEADPTPAEASWTVDTTPPAVTLATPANESTTTSQRPTFSGAAGTASGDSSTVTVDIYAGSAASGAPVQTLTTIATAGSWSVPTSSALTNGTYTAQAHQLDAAGNVGSSVANTFAVNAVAPTVTLTAPANGFATNDSTPMFAGVAGTATGDLPTITVNIYSGATATGSPVQTLTTTATAGAWSVGATTLLFDGEYTAQATQANEAENVGASAAVTFAVDTTPPAVTLAEPTENAVLGQAKPTFSGAAGVAHGDSTTVTLKIYSGSTATGSPLQTLTTTASGATWSTTPTVALADGTYTAQATQTDGAGNTGTSIANAFSVQTKAPGPVTGVTLTAVSDSSASFSWTNPSGTDFAGVVIRRAVGSTAPLSPTEGTAVAETSGETHTLTNNGLTAGATYSYALFAHNALHVYAAAATITVTATESTGSCTDTWSGAVNSEWGEAANWSSGHVPGPADWACIAAHAANLPVTIKTPEIVDGLTNAGELDVNSQLELIDAKNKSTSTGLLTDNGVIEVAHELEASSLKLSGTLGGSGLVSVSLGGLLVLEGGGVESGELVNEGSGSVPADDDFYVAAGAKFVNKGSLSFAVGSGLGGGCGRAATATEPAVPNGEFDSSGSITTNGKSETGSSAVKIGYPYYYYCLLTHDSGSLDVASGELDLGGSDFNFDTGSTVTGAASSTLVLEGTVSFNASSTTLPSPVVVTGNTAGAGNVSATDSLKLSGTLGGSGLVSVSLGGLLVLEGGGVESGELVNEGSGSVPADDDFYVAAGAKFVNKGSLSFAVGSGLGGGCGRAATATEPAVPNGEFDSSGSITTNGKSETGSSAVKIGYPYYYYCLLTHDSGSLDVASGELDLGGSDFNFDTGSTVTGAASSTLVLEGTVSFNASSTTLPSPVVVTGNTAGAGNVSATDSLKLSGTLGGSGLVSVSLGGLLVLEGGGVESGELVNEGSGSVPADDDFYVAAGAKFVNKGSLSFAVGSGLGGGCGRAATATEPAVPNGEFDSSGSITTNGKSETGSSAVKIGYPYYYYCLLTHDSGSLDVASGELDLGGSDFNFDTGSTVTGAASSTLVLEGTVSFNASSTTLPSPVVVTGNTAGAGNVSATDSLKLSGTLGGSGLVSVSLGGLLVLEGGGVESGELVNEGSGSVPADDDFYVAAGAKFVNKGSLSFAVGSGLGGGCGRAATATEPAVPNGEFDSSGSITTNGKSETGSSAVKIGYPYYYYCLLTHDSGSLDVASGELDLGGSDFNFDTGSTVTGAASSTLVLEGTVSFNASSTTLPSPVVVTGNTAGAGNVSATDSLKLSGTLGGSGLVSVSLGGLLVLEGGGVESGELVNEGSGSVPADDDFYVAAGAKFVNKGSLSFAVGSGLGGGCGRAATATEPAVPNGEFDSSGSITTNGKSETGSSAVKIGYPYYYYCLLTHDSGSLDVASGELDLGGSDFNFDTGSTVTGAASSTLVLEGTVSSELSSVAGIGTVEDNGHLHAMHSLSLPHFVLDGGLELSPGVLVNASSMGTLNGEIELDGTGDFGRLNVGSGVTLNSPRLEFTSLEYVPGCGSTITAVTAGSLAGGFGSVSGGNSLSEGSWEPEATSTSAGGYRYCPPPPAPAAQTYGSGGSDDSYNPSGYAAEPVNTATGAYNTEETDASMAGLGVRFSFTRSYTSSNPYSGPLGLGWTDSLNVFLTVNGSEVVLHSEDGQQTTYTPNGEGGYRGGPGTRSVLAARAGGGWTLTRQDQERFTFNEAGQLITQDDRNGIGLTLTYNEAGKLATVKDYAGREVLFTYNTAGLMASMSLPLGRTVTYSYNASNQLTSVADANGGTTSYEYNAQGLLESVTNQDGDRVVSNTYDGSGRVIEQTNALGKTAKFTYGEGETMYTDANGHEWKDVYDGDVLVEEVDPTGGVTRYAYDANLDRTAVTDPNGNTTTMTYNAAGDMLTRVSPLGATQTWTYDALNDVTSYTDGDGHKTTYTDDSHGNLLTTTSADGSSVSETHEPTTGAVAMTTDALGHTTTYGYNSEGDLTSVTSPLGEKTTYGYDAAGRRTSMVSPRGNEKGAEPSQFTTTYTYDDENRLLTVIDPDGHVTKTTYDKVGNRMSDTNPDGDTTTYTYDAQNELTAVTDPEGAKTTYTYDAVGNRTSTTTPLGETTTYTYDADNRLIKVTNALGHTATYGYDADGNRTSIVDATGATTTLGYNADNELASITYSDGTPSVSYEYDDAGNRTQMTDGTGTTVYTYNELNRLTAVNGPNGDYSYAYDENGHVTSRGYPDGTVVTYTYDPDQRLATVTAGGQTTTYSYDANSELTQTKLPSGNGYTETTAYNPAGLVTSVSDTNSKGTLTSFAYTYDDAGNPTNVVTATTTIAYTYNKDGRLTSACYGTSCAGGSYAYTYNADGSRTKLVDAAGTTTYTYNEGDELTSSEGPEGNTTYTYDADGRRTAAGSTTYTWNAANELTAVKATSGTTTYAYNGAGERISATTGATTTSYGYDINGTVPTLVLERNGSTTLRRYVWGEGLLSMNSGGSEYYVAHDAQGSVVALTSASGATEDLITYEPFGGVLSETPAKGAPAIPLKYDAELLDATGLYHMGARALDPTIGAFLSPDPRTASPSRPAISPYLYVNDQPTALTDPTGESSEGGYVSTGAGGDSEAQSYYNEISYYYAVGENQAQTEYAVGSNNDSVGDGVFDIVTDVF